MLVLALLATLAGCRQEPQTATAPGVDGPRVIAGDGVLCDLSQRLAPSQVQVDCLLGPGDDPHQFRLSPSQSRALAQSSLLLVNGGGLTPAIERLPNRVAIVDRLAGPGDPRSPGSPPLARSGPGGLDGQGGGCPVGRLDTPESGGD